MPDSAPSFRNFFAALRRRWFPAMSGSLSVPFTFASVYSDAKWEKLAWAILAVVCGGYAAFSVWRDERITRNALLNIVGSLSQLPTERHKALSVAQHDLASLAWEYRNGVTGSNRDAYAKDAPLYWYVDGATAREQIHLSPPTVSRCKHQFLDQWKSVCSCCSSPSPGFGRWCD